MVVHLFEARNPGSETSLDFESLKVIGYKVPAQNNPVQSFSKRKSFYGYISLTKWLKNRHVSEMRKSYYF